MSETHSSEWLTLNDVSGRVLLGEVRVGIELPVSERSRYAPPVERTNFRVASLAIPMAAINLWTWTSGDAATWLSYGSPRALWNARSEEEVAAMLVGQQDRSRHSEQPRCSGQLRYRRSMLGIAAALWAHLEGPLEVLNVPPTPLGLLIYRLRYVAPPPSPAYDAMSILKQFHYRV